MSSKQKVPPTPNGKPAPGNGTPAKANGPSFVTSFVHWRSGKTRAADYGLKAFPIR